MPVFSFRQHLCHDNNNSDDAVVVVVW